MNVRIEKNLIFDKLKESIRRILKSFKKNIVNIFKCLPVNSKYLGPPKGYYATSKEYWNTCQTNDLNNVQYIPFLQSNTFQRTPPKSIYEVNHWKFNNMYCHTNSETFVLSASNCRIFGDMGAVITHDDKLLLDVSQYFGGGEHFVFSYLKLPVCQQTNMTIAILSTSGCEGYFHWLIEAIPRVEILRKSLPNGLEGIDKFIVNKADKLPIIIESLSLLNIPLDKLIFSDVSTHIQAKMLVIPSLAGYTGNPSAWACEFLRESFLKHKIDIKPIGKIYISRSRAKYRKIVNEESVIACVSKFGFTPIYLEEHTFAMQIAILSNAEVIVAPHGAGLSNLIWCKAGTKVLEIFSPNYVNVCFWAIAEQVGLDYFYLIGDGEKPSEGFDPQMFQENISVSLPKLSRSLEMILN